MRHLLTAIFIFLFNILLPVKTLAVCPVCTVAVGAGLGLSRYLGIDDTVSGLWVGAFILSSGFWLRDWLKNRGIKAGSTKLAIVVVILFYLLTIIPLWKAEIIGHPFNTIFGIDKLLFGTGAGMILFLLALQADKQVRKMKGKQLMVYQKVIFPVLTLIFASLIFYFYIPKL